MTEVEFSMGPKSGVTYPVKVLYCGNCSMPIEVNIIPQEYG